MNTLAVIHRVEDLQVVCFAIVFAIMAWQSRRDKVFRFLVLSYLLGSAVSLLDVSLKPSHTLSAVNLALISLRYGAMTFALAAFVQASAWFPRAVLTMAALPTLAAALAANGAPNRIVMALDYGTLAGQFLLLAAMLLSRRDKATRTPRHLLATLFSISVLIRFCLLVAVLRPSPGFDWMRDQIWFLNSTIVGCMVPFTIIWMMNSRVHSDLRKQTVMDPLTGLLNRRGLQQAVTREMARYGRGWQDFAVAVADIDHFKAFNDTHGHGCGDLVLQAFAEIAQSTLRQTDIIARTGGEEFTILLPITNAGEMPAIIDRVRARLAENSINSASNTLHCTVSIGVTSTLDRSGLRWEVLLKEADIALYQAKHFGRNQTVQFIPGVTEANSGVTEANASATKSSFSETEGSKESFRGQEIFAE